MREPHTPSYISDGAWTRWTCTCGKKSDLILGKARAESGHKSHVTRMTKKTPQA